jgi:hypothetical protein
MIVDEDGGAPGSDLGLEQRGPVDEFQWLATYQSRT